MRACPHALLHAHVARTSLVALLSQRVMAHAHAAVATRPPAQMAAATGPEPHVRSAPFGLLAVDELRRHLGAWPHDGSVCRPRARPDTPLHAEHALAAALDSRSCVAVGRALADLFKLHPVPAGFAAATAAAVAAGRPPTAIAPGLLAAMTTLHATLERRFAAALAPVPVVLGALRELTVGSDGAVRHEVVVYALRRRVDPSRGGREWDAQREALLGALLYLPFAGFEAALQVFDMRDHLPLALAVRYVAALMKRRWLQDCARLLSSPSYAHVAAALEGMPAAALAVAPAALAAPPAALAAPPAATALEAVFSLLVRHEKFDLVRHVARGSRSREQALVRFLYRQDDGDGGGGGGVRLAALAGRLVRDFQLDLAALPDVRARLKRSAVRGLLRLPARDVVLSFARADPEVAQQLRWVVGERVAAGKTSAACAAAFHDAAEALWRALDAHQSASSGSGGGGSGASGAGAHPPSPLAWLSSSSSSSSRSRGDESGEEMQRAFSRGWPVERALSAVDDAAHALYRVSRGRNHTEMSGGALVAVAALAPPPPPRLLIPAPVLDTQGASSCGELEAEGQGSAAAATTTATAAAGASLTAFTPWPGSPRQLLHDEQGFLRLPTPRALWAADAGRRGQPACTLPADSSGSAAVDSPLPPLPVELRNVATLEQLRGVVATVHGGGGSAAGIAARHPPLLAVDCEWVSPLAPGVAPPAAGATTDASDGGAGSAEGKGADAVAVLTVGWLAAQRHHVWLVDLPALAAATRGDPLAQAALNTAFADLFCSPGLAPGKAAAATTAQSEALAPPGAGGGASGAAAAGVGSPTAAGAAGAPVATTAAAGSPAGAARAVALVFGGSQDFSTIAGAHPYLTAFGRRRQLDELPQYPAAEGPGVEAGASSGDAGVPPSPPSTTTAAGPIAFIDLMRYAHRRQVPAPQPAAALPPAPPLLPQAAIVAEGGGVGDAASVVAAGPAALAVASAASGGGGGGGQSDQQGSGGLAGLCGRVLGRPLSKYWQMSFWDRRPLLGGQAEYAALDAYVLPLLLARLAALPPRVAGGGPGGAAAAPIAIATAGDR